MKALCIFRGARTRRAQHAVPLRSRFVWLTIGGTIEPEVDRALGAGGRLIRERDLAAFASGGVAGIEGLHDYEAVFAGGLELFFAAYAAGKVGQLFRRAVVPELFEYGIGPTFCGGSFFDGVTVAVFTVGGHGVAHVEVCVAATVAAEDFDFVVHAAAAGPAVFDQGGGAVFEFDDAEHVIVGFG